MEWSRRGKHVLEGARISPHFCAVRTAWVISKPLDGKKFHAMRRLIMNEASDAEAARIRAYLASSTRDE